MFFKKVVEKGKTVEIELTFTDDKGNQVNPDAFEAVITEQKTNSVVKTIPEYTVVDIGVYRFLINTVDFDPGWYYINVKASRGNYTQEKAGLLIVQNHEGQ